MAIENEVVRFIAEIELDPQDKAAFSKALQEANDSCDELRKSISDTANQMAKLRAEGKENSDEFKKLEKNLQANRDKLKESIKDTTKYSSALDINTRSIKELRRDANQLRAALNTMHKEANPKLWKKYNDELKRVETRLEDLKIGTAGIKEPMLSMKNIFSKMKTVPGILSLITGGIALVKAGIEKTAEVTQRWGDYFGVLKAQSSAVIDHMVATITNWKNRSKASIKEVWDAAAEAQQLRDGLFEKNNALKIAEAEARIAIANEMKIVNDSTKTAEERLAAQERILEIEMNLARQRKNIANDSLDAAYKDLERIKMTEDDLEFLVDNYDKNSDIIKRAEEFIKNEKDLDKLKRKESRLSRRAEGQSTDSDAFIAWEDVREERIALEEAMKSAYSLELQGVVNMLKKYNLGNDNLIEAYVNARVQLLDAQAQYDEAEASQGRKRSTLVNQMTEEEQKRQEKVFNDKIKEADDAYTKELTDLKNSLVDKEITEEEYRERSLAAEGVYLLKKKAILQAYGKDVVAIEGQIADWRLEAGVPDDNPDRPAPIAAVSGSPLTNKATSKSDPGIAKTFDMEMTALNILHEAKAISEEEFLKRRNELYEKYGIEQQEQEQTLWDQGMESKLQATQKMLDAMGNAVSSAKDAELATIEAQMQAELAAAGDNAEKREQIEAKYEAKKLDVQKKYADIDMGIQIAQATAAGALAMVQAWNGAKGNPVLAGVIMALIGATTATQIATIIAQRNAIKNASSGGTSGGTEGTTQARVVTGFSEGGYTGDGARLEVAGVVHKGEYVVPQPELRDPYVASMVATIESRRRRRTSANALPGFAEGGYTGPVSGSRYTEDLLYQILGAIKSNNENPTPAYVVLSEINAKQETMNRFKQRTSLRRK